MPELRWNTFPAAGFHFCETEQHYGHMVMAVTFEIIWERSEENLVQSAVHNGYFTCKDCHQRMHDLWAEGQVPS